MMPTGPTYDWYNARCAAVVYRAPGGLCGALVRAVLGKRDGGNARVGIDPYVYEATLYEAVGRLHGHQGRALWSDRAVRDLGRAEERHRVRPDVERVRPTSPPLASVAVQLRIVP